MHQSGFINGVASASLPESQDLLVTSRDPPYSRSASVVSSKRPWHLIHRPSTAPEQEVHSLLPSVPSRSLPASKSNFMPDKSHHDSPTPYSDYLIGNVGQMNVLHEDDTDVTPNLSLGALPVMSDASFDSKDDISTGDATLFMTNTDSDWATFIKAYASGHWDPHRTPALPRFSLQASAELYRSLSMKSQSPSEGGQSRSLDNPMPAKDPGLSLYASPPKEIPSEEQTPPARGSIDNSLLAPFNHAASAPSQSAPTTKFGGLRPTIPLVMPQRLRSSFSSTSTPPLQDHSNVNGVTTNMHTHMQATVATMRWAAARVDISPLALPSPEHELTDPMRGVTATIPGSHPPETFASNEYVVTPGGTRRPRRLTGFWEGTTDVDNRMATGTSLGRLTPIVGSPSEGQTPENKETNLPIIEAIPPSAVQTAFPFLPLPASTPVTPSFKKDDPESAVDYFGDLTSPSDDTQKLGNDEEKSPDYSHIVPISENGRTTVPALPRRISLTRQTSSPLPNTVSQEARFLGGRVISDSVTSVKNGRSAKEEQMFLDHGYLVPPNPSDEFERRRALYKFNIWNTGPDLNFDRIAHLAKLVFSTKAVVISLIDGHEQWFKSEWGLKIPSCARVHSLCGHAILQRGDEPMVILDTQLDWRFARNPLVIGPPHMRFYAGAPLRTQDGYNIGTLAVIDDSPRVDFTPRQRHTLKEFAAVAMREMELWKDKIQLRIRDRIQISMEQFSRECLEIDSQMHSHEHPELVVGSSMDKVYDRAAKLVKRTLDVEGVIVMDVSHCEVLETMNSEGSVLITMHHGNPQTPMTRRQLTTEEYHELNNFFAKHPDGKISEGIIPPSFRPFLPTHIQYALTVPIFNIDKRPFALLCAYNTYDQSKRFLEGHELSYLRAIGVIILSAVLKRRMILADKAKSLFISNISHELRTPLHGILAAAELLSESPLTHSQSSFLQTVQACGTSLVETVNHVLDFTKLSGNSKAGGVENILSTSQVDLMQLVEEAVDGCWIGHQARTAIMGDSGIGSVYSPPIEDQPNTNARRKTVETVVDIGNRAGGWTLRCEKGGIRRVLMNLFGNSLKFTSDGFVHVRLRNLPCGDGDPPDKEKIELCVFDTGKGISQNFLKNQLFHPFSQENPLQTGTGLGLAIVSSIVTSESVGGKVDVWSEEGVGTEIKVTFFADLPDSAVSGPDTDVLSFEECENRSISLVGFDTSHRGTHLLDRTLRNYLESWWGFEIKSGTELGDIVIVNDDPAPIIAATEQRDTSRPFIILSAALGSPMIMSIVDEHENIGGFCRILYKPGGPSRLRHVLSQCVHALRIGTKSYGRTPIGSNARETIGQVPTIENKLGILRRNSEESHSRSLSITRPSMGPRSLTANAIPGSSSNRSAPSVECNETPDPDTIMPTITIGPGGTLLKSSVGSLNTSTRQSRVLVVEDNNILRNLLIKWLSNKGYGFRDAVDGRDGVNIFAQEGPFDVVLLDLSMPVLDGVSATAEIRQIESRRAESNKKQRPTSILALTGMSSLEDKRRAFEAGVDGYLVKPVAFRTLDNMFHKLGLS